MALFSQSHALKLMTMCITGINATIFGDSVKYMGKVYVENSKGQSITASWPEDEFFKATNGKVVEGLMLEIKKGKENGDWKVTRVLESIK